MLDHLFDDVTFFERQSLDIKNIYPGVHHTIPDLFLSPRASSTAKQIKSKTCMGRLSCTASSFIII